MIIYKHYINKPCLRCRHPRLEIQAFFWMENGIEKSTPVLVCPSRNGCGTLFDIEEYDLPEEDLRR